MTIAPGQTANRVTPVVETMAADLLTPLAVYLKLAETAEYSFLLESVEGGRQLARYSFIGADPVEVVTGGRDAYERLKEHFASLTAAICYSDVELPPFIGGAIGYLGFDACEWFEPTLAGKGDASEACSFMFYRSIVAFDHAKQVIRIVSLDLDGDRDASERNAAIRTRLEDPYVPTQSTTPASGHPSLSRRGVASGSVPSTTANWSRPDFEAAVVEIKELINAGECYQAVLSQCFTRETTASPVAIYRALRSLNPSPYMFLLRFGKKTIVGASPEMLVKCTDKRLEYRPIAGTRPRGKTTVEDDALAEEMRHDAKEVAEHEMLVDLGRNDLGRVAKFGTVKVDSHMLVEKYSHVQHLVSSLSAELADGKDRFDALASCFPAGTVSGAPKVAAIEIIRGLEPTPRGVYAGAVGYFDYSGNMDMCIAIRTLVIENGVAKIQAGAGIVADSVPASEFDECVNKAKGLMRAIDIAEGHGG
ncbi:MAG: anthranilate synthase component I family protein [Acidobacteria bacterium]|nr:anthranilate synthase component I family protein [Acidobacteriota bacterium]